jgi:hypothetical protein
MDEFEWLRRNSPPTTPSHDVTQRHRTELRAAIATEGADGTRPRRPRRRLRSRHRVLVSTVVVVLLCGLGAGIIALAGSGGDDQSRVGAPATSAIASTTTTPLTCPGALPRQYAIPAGFGSAVAGPAKESSDPVEPGQQVTHWSSDKAELEIRWPADAKVQQQFGALAAPQNPDDHSSSTGHDVFATVDDRGVARRRAVDTFPDQVPQCQSVEISFYGTDLDAVNSAANAFNDAPYRTSQPLVTTTKADLVAPVTVAPCAGPTDEQAAKIAVSDVKYVPTVGGEVAAGTFDRPEAALADFLTTRTTLYQRGYQELQLADGSLDFVAEPRAGVVVTLVHVTPTGKGWTVTDWSASGC